jgi:hypothetical protein
MVVEIKFKIFENFTCKNKKKHKKIIFKKKYKGKNRRRRKHNQIYFSAILA